VSDAPNEGGGDCSTSDRKQQIHLPVREKVLWVGAAMKKIWPERRIKERKRSIRNSSTEEKFCSERKKMPSLRGDSLDGKKY